MDFSNKKIKIIVGLIAAVLVLAIGLFVYSLVFIWPRDAQIKQKIGDFSITKEAPYQGGTIIEAMKGGGAMSRPAVLFFKDSQLQKLPDKYVIDSVWAQLSGAERENKTISIQYREEYNSGNQDKNGQDIIYKNVFLMVNELPESRWVKNAMYPAGSAKYQIIIIDEFGQIQDKFLSSQIL